MTFGMTLNQESFMSKIRDDCAKNFIANFSISFQTESDVHLSLNYSEFYESP